MLEQLKRLLPVEFEELLFNYGIPPAYLPAGGQLERAIALLRYAEAKGDSARLQTLLDQYGTVPAMPTPPAQSHGAQTVLFLAANPADTVRLRLDQELRDIDEGLRRATQRDQFRLTSRWAVRAQDVRRALLDEKPRYIHFCGHGEGEEGLLLENEQGEAKAVGSNALAGLFRLFAADIHCVLLNACYSESQAWAIAEHIPYVIGMKRQISDQAALSFAVGFYDALGAGRDVPFAYDYACNALEMEGIPEALTPVLLEKT